MDTHRILSELDAEIGRLQRIRSELSQIGDGAESVVGARKRGRPNGSMNIAKSSSGKKKRQLSPEGRKRIADAMKKRWAERKAA